MLKIKLFILCFFVSLTVVIAQQKEKKTLKEILFVIEKSFDIKFSFSEETIKDKEIEFNISEKNLDIILRNIKHETGLQIKKISTRYYTISSKQKTNACGYIYDAITKSPVSNVAILSKNNGVETNEKGYFKLKDIETKDSLKISLIGYKELIISAKDFVTEKCKHIFIEDAYTVLEEVIIKSYLTNGVVKKADGSITLQPQKQGILPGLTEADVLLSTQQLPGIQSPFENASGIHIRGGTPDQNLILFDGIKLYSTSHFFGSISAFNPYIVDNVTVYKNASNAKYGNHIAGVIDIETIKEVPEKLKIGAGFNFTNADVNTTIPLGKKIGLQFSFRRSVSDLLNTPTFDKLSQKVFQNTIISDGETLAEEQPFIENENAFSFIDFNTKLIFQPNKNNTISIQQITFENNLNYTLENTNENKVRNDFIDIENDGFGITWKKAWGKTLTQQTGSYYSKYALFYNGTRERNTMINDYTTKHNNVEEINFNTSFSKRINNISTLNFGYEFTHSNVSYNLEQENFDLGTFANNSGKNINNQQSILLEYVVKNAKKFNLHIGFRNSYMPLLNKVFFEPRIYTRTRLFPSLWINASAEIKQQYTSKIVEFFTSDFGLENELWAISDDNEIPVLKSEQYTAGILFNKKGWILDAEIYLKKITGITSLATGFNDAPIDGNNPRETIFNGSATILGVDVLLKKNWGKRTSTWVSYTFGDNTLNFSGLNEGRTFKGNFSISNSAYIAQQIRINNFDLSAGWTLRTGLPFSNLRNGFNEFQQEIQEITDFNINTLPMFHRLDVSATYDFFWNKKKDIKSKLGISFINVYNRKNIIQRTYERAIDPNDPNKFIINTIDTFSLGFTPNLVFRVQF